MPTECEAICAPQNFDGLQIQDSFLTSVSCLLNTVSKCLQCACNAWINCSNFYAKYLSLNTLQKTRSMCMSIMRYFKTHTHIFQVTKRLALGDLKTFLINFKTIKPEEIRDIFLQVVEAVLALRKNHILHNDIRLSNVYVEKEQSDDLIVKVRIF